MGQRHIIKQTYSIKANNGGQVVSFDIPDNCTTTEEIAQFVLKMAPDWTVLNITKKRSVIDPKTSKSVHTKSCCLKLCKPETPELQATKVHDSFVNGNGIIPANVLGFFSNQNDGR